MVKGVNKTVIEVNDTGSKLFEKIVFYVTPQYGNMNSKELARAASEFSFIFDANSKKKNSLRKKLLKRRRIFLFSAVSAVIALATAVILFVIM